MSATALRPETQADADVEEQPRGSPRFVLQQRAPRNIRSHWLRGVVRLAVLAASDIGMFLLLRTMLRGLRAGFFGDQIAAWTSGLFPSGFLGGWQFAAALILSLSVAGAYGAGEKRRDTGRVLAGVALAALLVLYTAAWTSPVQSAFQFVATLAVFGGVLVGARVLIDVTVVRLRPRLGVSRAVLVAGADTQREDLLQFLRASSELQIVQMVHLHDGPTASLEPKVRQLAQIIEQDRIETVLLWGSLSQTEFAAVVDLALASGCRLLSGRRAAGAGIPEPRGMWVEGTPLMELNAPTLKGWQLGLKRVVDLTAATIGLTVAIPLFAVIALAIRLESRGPILFRQWRVGRAGRLFRIYKFRSMVVDAEQRLEQLRTESIYPDQCLFKVVDDPRVTSVGRWLRRTSLDELPQLLNVLRGEMSLVGPRPPLPTEVSAYKEHHYLRFDVKPGVTGPWQVSGRNGITDFEEVVRLEREYIRRWTLGTDLRIFLRTIPVVLRMRGAH